MIVSDEEYLDFNTVPESRGVPPGLYRIATVGLLIIFAIGGAVCLMSGYGHHWPAESTLRIPLGTLNH